MKSIIRTMFGELSPWGKFWLWLGLVSLAAAAGMSFAVGWKMTALHALFLACLSFVTAFLPEAAYRAWNEGKRGVTIALALIAVPLFAIEFGQHAAYTAGVRGVDIVTAKVQNAVYDNNQDSVAQAKRDIVSAEALIKRLSWLPSDVTAAGMAAKIQAQKEAIRQEEKRGGCGPKCLALTQELAEMEKMKAGAEDLTRERERMAAAKRVLEDRKEKANATQHATSQAEMMNSFLSEAVALIGFGSLTPTAGIEKATQTSANFAVAAAGTGLPALALFIAGLYRIRGRDDEGSGEIAPSSRPVPRETNYVQTVNNPTPLQPRPEPGAVTIIHKDESNYDRIRKLLGEVMTATPEPRTA